MVNFTKRKSRSRAHQHSYAVWWRKMLKGFIDRIKKIPKKAIIATLWYILLAYSLSGTTRANGNHHLKSMLSPVLASMLASSKDISVKERAKTKAEYMLQWKKEWLGYSFFLKGMEWGMSSSGVSGREFSGIALKWLREFGPSCWLRRMRDSSIRSIMSSLQFWGMRPSRPSRRVLRKVFRIRSIATSLSSHQIFLFFHSHVFLSDPVTTLLLPECEIRLIGMSAWPRASDMWYESKSVHVFLSHQWWLQWIRIYQPYFLLKIQEMWILFFGILNIVSSVTELSLNLSSKI